jgi:hypothetical protein
MSSVPVQQPLAYAEPGVRTAPRRTLLRILGRWMWNVLRTIVRLIQAALLGLGFLVLAIAILTQAVLVPIATTLLFAGRLRWDGAAVRVRMVRAFNRACLGVSRPLRFGRDPVPLATPHEGNGRPPVPVQKLTVGDAPPTRQ